MYWSEKDDMIAALPIPGTEVLPELVRTKEDLFVQYKEGVNSTNAQPIRSVRPIVGAKYVRFRRMPNAYPIEGELFNLEKTSEGFCITHPRWSLIGMGGSVIEAENDLLGEARELAEVFLNIPIKSLDHDAFELRNFLLKII